MCEFKVFVNREFCPDLPDPVGGLQACDRWGPDLRYKACSIHCNNGYDFSIATPLFYSCGEDGAWRPRAQPDMYTFKYPQCSAMHTATRLVRMNVDYPAQACNEAGRSTLADKLLTRMQALNKQWSLCGGQQTAESDGLCPELNITVTCSTRSTHPLLRARRQTQDQQQFYTAHVSFPANRCVDCVCVRYCSHMCGL